MRKAPRKGSALRRSGLMGTPDHASTYAGRIVPVTPGISRKIFIHRAKWL
ncbi:hypothetical protein [Novosphingobium sp.]|jgi:hypothetical protein